MTISKATKKRKPKKPYPDFPLNVHSSGQWCKKIRGKVYCFGTWDNPQAALEKYQADRDYLQFGKRPPGQPGDNRGLTLRDAINFYLLAQEQRDKTGEITRRHFDEIVNSCRMIVGYVDPDTNKRLFKRVLDGSRLVESLTPDDFRKLRVRLATKLDGSPVSPNSLKPRIARTKTLFKWLYDDGLIDQPIRFGRAFDPPKKAALRKRKHQSGKKLFSVDELKTLMNGASVTLKTMILLGLNAALGNNDIGQLTFEDIDLESGWLDSVRSKTGIGRKAKLWPETIKAIRDYLAIRPEPKNERHANFVFITQHVRGLYSSQWAVTNEFTKLKTACDINGTNRGFYTLRHVAATRLEDLGDSPAKSIVMGHAMDNDIAGHYGEEIINERIERVCNHVRTWLYGAEGGAR